MASWHAHGCHTDRSSSQGCPRAAGPQALEIFKIKLHTKSRSLFNRTVAAKEGQLHTSASEPLSRSGICHSLLFSATEACYPEVNVLWAINPLASWGKPPWKYKHALPCRLANSTLDLYGLWESANVYNLNEGTILSIIQEILEHIRDPPHLSICKSLQYRKIIEPQFINYKWP